MVVRMRSTRGHTGHRRGHHALDAARISICKDCGKAHLRHYICNNCGKYRGKLIINVQKIIANKQEKIKERQKKSEVK